MKKILTIILDGFGIRDSEIGNAIKMAKMPNYNFLMENYPHSFLGASEAAVGLPSGQFGNSEIGHLTIGAGRVIKSKIGVIGESLAKDAFEQTETFNNLIHHIKQNNSVLHLMGLVSDGGVHSNIDYFKEIIKILQLKEIKNVCFHAITDGRDTKVDEGINYLKDLEQVLTSTGVGKIVSISGRYYAMDRDKKYERTKEYYDAIVNGLARRSTDVETAMSGYYSREIYDEFIPPILIDEDGKIKDNDGLLWLNFRPDRAIQILTSLTNKEFDGFNHTIVNNLKVVTMFPTAETVIADNIFPDISENGTSLGRYFSELGLTQGRIAETEKYAHVTYYFDGGIDQKLPGAEYYLLPSPKVATYDLSPEMRTVDITKKVVSCMEKDLDFILVNYACPDMLGHTGIIEATVKSLEILDECLGKIIKSAETNFYTIILLSDHGNADYMVDESGNPVTSHSISKVPFIITDKKIKLKDGILADVAPTILSYMDIAIPNEMENSKVLFEKI